jgi:hypothetical protein
MKQVVYTKFEYQQVREGKTRTITSRHMMPIDALPKGAKPVGPTEVRELPETEEESKDALYTTLSSGWTGKAP